MELPASSLRLVLIVLVIGFPAFLIFSWVYELTPAGLERDEPAARSAERKIDVTIILVLVAIIAVMAAGYLLPDRPRTAGSTNSKQVVLPSVALANALRQRFAQAPLKETRTDAVPWDTVSREIARFWN